MLVWKDETESERGIKKSFKSSKTEHSNCDALVITSFIRFADFIPTFNLFFEIQIGY